MDKTFNYRDSMNMVIAVCGSYVTRDEVMRYFEENYEQDQEFGAPELKHIVRSLTTGKEKITPKMEEVNLWNIKKKKNSDDLEI